MEHAPLRPVPARPAGPVDPVTAIREVGLWLPTVTPAAARAFALVVLAERPRSEAAVTLGVSERDLGELLASARKELRQGIVTLGGSGWCERVEGLISDRLDGALAEGDVRRLDVHLRNCSRCVEHERRLVQATDALVGALGGLASPTGGASAAPLVEAPEEAAPPNGEAPKEAEPPDGEAPKEAPEEAAPPDGEAPKEAPEEAAPPDGEAPKEAPEEAEPPDGEAPKEEAPSPKTPPEEVPPVEAPPEELPPEEDTLEEVPPAVAVTSDQIAAEAEVLVAVTSDQIAAAAEVLVTVRTRRQIAAAVAWNAMIALAVLLAVATIALTVAGILGAQL